MTALYMELFAQFFCIIPLVVVGLGCITGWILCIIAWTKEWHFKWLFFAFFLLMPTSRIYSAPGNLSRADLNTIGCFHMLAVCVLLAFAYKLYREMRTNDENHRASHSTSTKQLEM